MQGDWCRAENQPHINWSDECIRTHALHRHAATHQNGTTSQHARRVPYHKQGQSSVGAPSAALGRHQALQVGVPLQALQQPRARGQPPPHASEDKGHQ